MILVYGKPLLSLCCPVGLGDENVAGQLLTRQEHTAGRPLLPHPLPRSCPAAVCITCLLGIVLWFVETASPPLGGSQCVLPGNLLFYKGFTTSGSCLREELHSWAFRVCFLITREVV